jgi:hypothetical protein
MWSGRLRAALAREGQEVRAEVTAHSLAGLEAGLRAQGVALEAQALRRVAWAALGQPRPRTVPLTPTSRARLAHLTDLRDVFSPADAERVGREFAGEVWLAPDLLAVRPWLPQTPAREVVGAVMRSQWSGLLALLGEHGPWVYAASVADLQALGRAYSAVVEAAAHAPEDAALDAALAQPDRPSLLARLEATDHRQPGTPESPPAHLVALEQAFWTAAQEQAQAGRARRGTG